MTTQIHKITWYVPLELNHSSYIYTSLIEFCKAEDIPLTISTKNLNHRGRISIEDDALNFSNHFNPKVNWIQVHFMTGLSKKIAFDLNDIPNHFSLYALKNAEIYYKRCYQDGFVSVLPEEYCGRIKPMGIPFMVRPNEFYFINKIRIIFFAFKFLEIFKLDRLILKRFQIFKLKAIQHFRDFKNTRTVSDFNDFNPSVLGNIFYQKRLFEESSADVVALNRQRVRIIAILKRHFPDNLFGGLQKNTISELKYAELISNIDGNPHAFLKAMRKCGICIYTNGLKGSPGWTLPEFLSQGKCIVAEQLENKSPHPLINNKHVVFYSSENELVTICNELIRNSDKRHYLGKNARKYYEEYISPTVFFEKLLTTICE